MPIGRHSFESGGKIVLKGTTFVVDDKYELVKHISHGAYGIVCSALNKQTKKKVAIKKVF